MGHRQDIVSWQAEWLAKSNTLLVEVKSAALHPSFPVEDFSDGQSSLVWSPGRQWWT